MNQNKRFKPNPPSQLSDASNSGILNERVLRLVFESMKWDLQAVCSTASVNCKLRAIAKRLLWRELCVFRAPRMLTALSNNIPHARFYGYWHALAKIMFYCCGCASSTHFKTTPGHFTKECRFSKTSGRSFLVKKCRGDLLYVSDPCEHEVGENEEDLGIYRGVFKGFMRSKTRACLIARQVELEEKVRCPYCGARVWSMSTARLVPRSAARRLGCRNGELEYFVCVYGHLHGTCWLTPLSSDEDYENGYSEEEDDDEGAESNGCSTTTSSAGDEIVSSRYCPPLNLV